MITKAALIEQAFALAEHDVSSVGSYDALFHLTVGPSVVGPADEPHALAKEKIVQYATTVMDKNETAVSSSLAVVLKQMYGHNDDNSNTRAVAALDVVPHQSVGNWVKQSCAKPDMISMAISVLGLLVGEEHGDDDDNKTFKKSSTAPPVLVPTADLDRTLPVAAVLSLLAVSNNNDDEDERVFHLPQAWLDYFAQTVQCLQEHELQKDTNVVPSSASSSSEPPLLTRHAQQSDAAVLSQALEQVLAGALQDSSADLSSSSSDDDDDDDDDDDSDDETAAEENPLQQGGAANDADDQEDSSSSSSSSSEAAIVLDRVVVEDEEGDAALRRALSLSLAEEEPATEVVDGPETIASAQVGEEPVVQADESTLLPVLLPKPPQALVDVFPDAVDPTSQRFGAIPASYVLIHLLRAMTSLLERRRIAVSEEPQVVVPGGMGSTLFGEGTKKLATMEEEPEPDVVLQLATAVLILVFEKREEAIGALRKAIAREQQAAKGDDNDEDESEAPLSSGEEDDPALTLALNYVEDDVPLSSEALERKGMRRKAAAAAHDAAALLRSLRKRTEECKDKVRLYSYALLYSMKTLKSFLRNVTRRNLCTPHASVVSEFHSAMPSTTSARLSFALTGLMSVSMQSSYLALVGGDEFELEQVFLPFELYQQSLATWGECMPLLYSSGTDLASVLGSLIEDCSPSRIVGPVPSVRSFDSIVCFPSSELEPKLHQLQILCRRMRVGDVLEKFVSKYVPFAPKLDEEDSSPASSLETPSFGDPEDGPRRASALIALLGEALNNVVGARYDIQRLYLALCHRCHARILLFDGLYGATETEAEDPSISKPATKSLSTGDTVRVSSHASSQLQFDTTKCSDSIAIVSDVGAAANGSSVNQRASKVWGSVLATQYFSPKSGVHRWAVRLDKCERGHVFVGVSTAQASVKTYVGGDKHGWGMIGTQALWHDRRKVRKWVGL